VTRILAVTGTDTEVGKTVVTAALAGLVAGRGQRVAVVKPVQTGVAPDGPGDLDEVRRLSGVSDVHEFTRLAEPLAPATAARRAGVMVPDVSAMADSIRALEGRDLILVEGAGGLLVELARDGGTLADLCSLLGAPLVVVARAGLGTLNAVALTCEAIRARNLECLGVVVGAWPADADLAATCNLEDLPRYARAPLLGRLPEDAGRLQRQVFLDLARDCLSQALARDVVSGQGVST
jgi:dethiobiotin synthetase